MPSFIKSVTIDHWLLAAQPPGTLRQTCHSYSQAACCLHRGLRFASDNANALFYYLSNRIKVKFRA